MFVTATGERFWGHERMEWAIRHGLIPGRSTAERNATSEPL